MRKRKWPRLEIALAGAIAVMATSAFAGQVTLYQQPGFEGRRMAVYDAVSNLKVSAFNMVAASVVVADGTWEACTEANFGGRCAQLVPGNYGQLSGQLTAPIASIRQIGLESGPARVVVSPDTQPVVVGSGPAPIVINPGTAPVVINSAPAGIENTARTAIIVNPDSPQVVAAPVMDAVPVPAGPRVILYQRAGSGLRAVELTSNVEDLDERNFRRSAEAAFVSGGVWRLCDGEHGRGYCADYSPGRYESLGALNGKVRSVYLIAPVADRVARVASLPAGRAVLYQYPNFGGPSAVVEYGRAADLDWARFRGPATSLRVESGTWLVCSEMGYQGECRVVDPGDYPVMTEMLSEGIASARQIWRPEYGSLNRYRGN